MPLYRISYISRAPETRGELRRMFAASLLSQARRNNDERGVTGFLAYADDYFLQMIEGGRGIISDLIMRIGADDRHRDLHIIRAEPADSRLFHQKMACFDIVSTKTPLLMRFSVSAQFCPYQLAPNALDELFAELVVTARQPRQFQPETQSSAA
ncbi:MAG: BLUF domain-containing protein [Pseudomonadota bacterium]